MLRTRSLAVGLAGLVVIGAGCGGGDEKVVVFAASSLTDVFDRLEDEFESAEPGVDVVVTAGGSSSLVAQVADGAPADVLATADQQTMTRALSSLETTVERVDFARNGLVIAVESGNPFGITDLRDLPDVPVVVMAAPEVPAGAYAATALNCAGVDLEPASYEQNVRAVASKVALGEADAGLVYRTDIDARLDSVELPEQCQVQAEYPIAALNNDDDATQRFMRFILGPTGDRALVDAGFELP